LGSHIVSRYYCLDVTTPTTPRRLLMLSLMATFLGFAGGGAAWFLLHLIDFITSAALFGRLSFEHPTLAHLEPSPRLFVVAIAGALLISLLAKWSPVIRGHGIPEAMEAILSKQSRVSPRATVAKPVSAALAIGSGAPFGAEGPIIVTGGALGSLLGQVVRVSPAERKILLASGAAAGMSATFGAPLAAVVLAIELLLFEFSARAFVPLVVAAATAGGVHSALFGSGPLFDVPHHDYAGLSALPAFVVLGLACGLLAVVITRGLFTVEALYRRLPLSEFWHPVIGAVGFATVGLFVPRALGVGYDAIGDVLASRLTIGTIAALAAAKLIAWWLALGSGTSGGTLAPILLMSAAFGSVFGTGVEHLLPGREVAAGAFAVVAMAATFGAATRATFASIVFVFELTRDYEVILPLMIATVLADLVYSALSEHSLMTEKLTRRGLHVGRHYGVDPFTTVRVGRIMTTPVATVAASASVGEVRRLFLDGGHGAYPVVDDGGALAAIVARGDLLDDDITEDEPVLDHASTDVVCVGPDDTAVTVLHAMLDEQIEHVPVVEAGRLVGICTRTDLLKVRQQQFDLERHQDGLTVSQARRRLRR
jgi:H+/Cl- antiporter ClcA